jgi:hypothetical protein
MRYPNRNGNAIVTAGAMIADMIGAGAEAEAGQ